jgi:hypothetical protein
MPHATANFRRIRRISVRLLSISNSSAKNKKAPRETMGRLGALSREERRL